MFDRRQDKSVSKESEEEQGKSKARARKAEKCFGQRLRLLYLSFCLCSAPKNRGVKRKKMKTTSGFVAVKHASGGKVCHDEENWPDLYLKALQGIVRNCS